LLLRALAERQAGGILIDRNRRGVYDRDASGRDRRIKYRNRLGQICTMGPKPVAITKLDRSNRRQLEAAVDPGYSLTDEPRIGNIALDNSGSGRELSKSPLSRTTELRYRDAAN